MQSPKWLSRKEVRDRYKTSDSSLSRWINRGAFPAPQTIGVNTQRFDGNVLDEYDENPDAWKTAHSQSAA